MSVTVMFLLGKLVNRIHRGAGISFSVSRHISFILGCNIYFTFSLNFSHLVLVYFEGNQAEATNQYPKSKELIKTLRMNDE